MRFWLQVSVSAHKTRMNVSSELHSTKNVGKRRHLGDFEFNEFSSELSDGTAMRFLSI